ncbi:MAG: fibronectin type III domain-containing protein [Desulfobacula sp.]|uniref:fibronectin type III domain-containing protein n=1 Tax=Desulfobacula sp. TaxID=2593537 RepID=UPI0025B89E98|nr:fibronectin type III domain-containing protein [Desulfobacula sp.]MCD4720921.1 fibronectin type III domain-containing protein [Desulfobacula sp.]
MNSFFINRNFKKLWFVLIVAGFWFFLLGGTASADCVEIFSWLPNSESNITGYKIYYGQTNGGPYPNVVNVGKPAPVEGRIHGTVPGLTCGQQYYFVCVAVNDADIESAYSTQADVTPNSAVPGSPVNLMIIE